MRPVCRIAVDVHERLSGIGDRLYERGAEVAVRHLVVGDYDLGSGVLVERKTTADLHLSVQRGRFWSQIGRLREGARLPYLLVEGATIDDRAIDREAVRGVCLAVLGQGVPIIWSRDAADSALWLWLLAQRAGGLRLGRDRPAYAQRLKPPSDLVPEAMLAVVPSISVGIARALLAEFGTIAAIAAASPSRWLEVRGFGVARAHALDRALHR